MAIYSFNNIYPTIDESAYIFEDAVIIGDVKIGPNVSIWPGVIIRGDKAAIEVKEGCNIQERSVLHADPGFPIVIENNVTVGHGVILHGCTIGANSVIGIGAILLNGVEIGTECLVTAGSIINSGPKFSDGSLIAGNPASVLIPLSKSDIVNLHDTAIEYQNLAVEYKNKLTLINNIEK